MGKSNMTELSPASADTEIEHPDELQAGMKLLSGQYTIVKFLNSGGFGITYLAKDSLDRNVVIKECFPDAICRRTSSKVRPRSRAHTASFASVVDMFVQEARSQAKLVHPNIAGVHQVFNDNDTAYMAIDFVDGGDLLDMIESEEELSPDDVQHWLRRTLDAVGFIHSDGMLHRDISPDNILVNEKNEPVLIDFGAAREQASKTDRVLSTMRVVKDGYSPQEFYVAGSDQSPASDLYALGATFYHAVTGSAPADSQTRLSAIASEQDDPYSPLAGQVKDYPEAFLASIDKALKVLPKERHQSAQDWLDSMDGKAVQKKTSAATATSTKKKGKAPLLVAASVAALVAAGFGAMKLDLGGATNKADTIENAAFASALPAGSGTQKKPLETTAATPKPVETEAQTKSVELAATTPEPVETDTQTKLVELAVATPKPVEADTQTKPAAAQPEVAQTKPAPTVITATSLAAQGETKSEVKDAFSFNSEWTVNAPFETTGISLKEGNFAQITLVRPNLDPEAQSWLKSGGIIYSVNGIIVYDRESIIRAIEQSPDLSEQKFVTVSLRVRTSKDAPLEEKDLTLPVVRALELPTGFQFETSQTSNGWETRVARVPLDADTKLKIGDIIVSEAQTNTVMRDVNDIETAIGKLGESSAPAAYFTITREGKLDSATIPLGNL